VAGVIVVIRAACGVVTAEGSGITGLSSQVQYGRQLVVAL